MNEIDRLRVRAMGAANAQDNHVADELAFFDVKQLLAGVSALLRNEQPVLMHANIDSLVRRLAATALTREVHRRLEVEALEDEAAGA